jgi:hypothetical protein
VQTEIKEGRQKRREREEKEKAELKALVLRTESVVKVL